MVPRQRIPESTRSAARPDELVELGRIVNRHGIRGELRLLPHNPDAAGVLALSTLLLTRDDGSVERRRVISSRPHKHFVLVTMEGVSSANDADALVGCGVAVPRADLPPLEAQAVYHIDLIGCAVHTTGGELLGTVREVIVTGSNDVCVVRGGGREVLIPMTADVIASLDTAARTIVVHPVPGLLEA